MGKSKIKQVIVMRKDLNMTKGKMIAQGSHASLGITLKMLKETPEDKALTEWLEGIFTKVCVLVKSEEELDDVYENAVAAGLPVKLIVDSGLTMFNGVKTKTCLAIGPAKSEEIDKITGHLRLL